MFEGTGLEECTAGETASFRIQACDSQGYRLDAGHADFTLEVTAGGAETLGAQLPRALGRGVLPGHSVGCQPAERWPLQPHVCGSWLWGFGLIP